MRQLYLAAEARSGRAVTLSIEDSHYLLHVLRLKAGDRFPVLDSRGTTWEAAVESVSRGLVVARLVRIVNAAPAAVENAPAVTLIQALPKGQKMDLIVRMATELGVARIIPLLSERTASQHDPAAISPARRERWERIARQAVQQCGRGALPRIEKPITLLALLADWPADACGLFCHEAPQGAVSLHHALSRAPAAVAVAVGPEGGFAPAETAAFREHGFSAVCLGRNVLRTETAAVSALAAIFILLGEKNDWNPRLGE